MKAAAPRASQGATALEMALLLPVLLLVLYGMVLFSIMFAVKSTVAFAAAEGARASLEFQSANDPDAALALRRGRAQAECERAGEWLSNVQAAAYTCTAVAAPCVYNADLRCVKVTASYNYRDYPIVPLIGLMGEALLPLLNSEAESQVSTRSLL
ncbi:TadE/TadG family type IV pilus assembly protein [Aquabacterium sp. A08]|uniref:TadE/TadG family type IV pilus assembly protein n=1 Tax=Aquabacterium sp. A08 TaxID=2718532 RepID=UPI0014237F3F|nr:TadE/TadG family type IV pilus assembly protein [Aquabacterium sp. A08]NIC40979.1 pilus assembly protein [Aquabacterium sp. A08]